MIALQFPKNDEAEWGKTRIEYATIDRMKERRRARERRSQHVAMAVRERNEKGWFVAAETGPVEGQVFITSTGVRAYVAMVQNMTSGPGSSAVDFRQTPVSLPFISMQHPGYEQVKSA